MTVKKGLRRPNVLGVRFWYTGIRVKDLEESIRFYKEALGFNVILKGKMKTHEGTYVQMRTPTGKQILELNYYPPGSKFFERYVTGSELDHLAFSCDDVRKSYKKALAGGATSAVEPWDEGGSTLAFVRDPDGVWIELHSRS